jgi:lysophospholipase L1-like esterase
MLVSLFGDSNTLGVGCSSPANSYPAVLRRLLASRPEPPCVSVCAVYGTGFVAPDEGRAEAWLRALESGPQYVVLAFVTGDAFYGHTPAAVAAAAGRRYDQAAALGATVLVVLSPCSFAGVYEINVAVAGVVPPAALVCIPDALPSDFADPLHLNDVGSRKLAREVSRRIA